MRDGHLQLSEHVHQTAQPTGYESRGRESVCERERQRESKREGERGRERERKRVREKEGGRASHLQLQEHVYQTAPPSE